MIRFNNNEHGPVPFWFWNGDQQEAEITRQLEHAAEGGVKGMAIHARVGNQTEYMSERWFALTRHTCEEALRLGLDIWLYDEEGFPSGTVGERLQKDDPFFQQKFLTFRYLTGGELATVENIVAVFDSASYAQIDISDVSADKEALVFHVTYHARYVDTLQPETVERFMEMTHERYYTELKDYFGKPLRMLITTA